MVRKRFQAFWLMGAAWLFFLSACGLPGDLKQAAKKKVQRVASAREEVQGLKAAYLDLAQSQGFEFFEFYATREDWPARFDQAGRMLDLAERDATQGRIAAIIKENDKEKAGELRIELLKIDKQIRKALNTAGEPKKRMADLERIRQQAPQLVKTAETSQAAIHTLMDDLENGFIPKALADFPGRAEDIRKRFEPLKQIQVDVDAAMGDAATQLQHHDAGRFADYAVIGAATDLANQSLGAIRESDTAYRAKIGELERSYTKILEDMRLDHYVTIGRVSWDERSDYWTEHTVIYPPSQVTEAVYAYFSKLNPNTVPAAYQSYRNRIRINVKPDDWAALRINPSQNWPSRSDSHAEFWIEDLSTRAFHKYLVIENDTKETTDWIEVDDEDYFDSYNDLGMEILSKPYGFFEEEAVTEASPPGMAVVGDPRYGQWRTDPGTGRSFWYYYGIYSFLNRGMGYRYYRGDWDQWRGSYRNRKPYYGRTGAAGAAYGTYGTHVRTDSRYQNTDFAKRGGLKTQAPSVRGAGPAARGGGPGRLGK